MNNPYTLRIALTTCDDIFEAGGVSASITRIARGLSTHYNAQVDILMLNSNQQAEFNPAGRNGIIQFDQNLDNVSIYKITPWTGDTSEAQHWVDIHYALLEIARERQYDLMMDVFTFTSLHDGCPNTVLEAMLAGTPIVATRAGAVPELIENGKHGLLIQPGSATVRKASAATSTDCICPTKRVRIILESLPGVPE